MSPLYENKKANATFKTKASFYQADLMITESLQNPNVFLYLCVF